eukprot:TRINITY_DN50239_c0_g1_i1.p1 TRINITY_DN50239_c0_g1~~TRINITY_DN50239_c0_g1_i1.p1  ORF type:complete len:265 (+),score=28.22 TRINITY_DN50239_c0_g1_i1:80-874(+)
MVAAASFNSLSFDLQTGILEFLFSRRIEETSLVESCQGLSEVHGHTSTELSLRSLVPSTLRGRFLKDGSFLCSTELPLYSSKTDMPATMRMNGRGHSERVCLLRVRRRRLEITWLANVASTAHGLKEQLEAAAWWHFGEVIGKKCRVIDTCMVLNWAFAHHFSQELYCYYRLKPHLVIDSGLYIPCGSGPNVYINLLRKSVIDLDALGLLRQVRGTRFILGADVSESHFEEFQRDDKRLDQPINSWWDPESEDEEAEGDLEENA